MKHELLRRMAQIAPGYYDLDGLYVLVRTTTGWRWHRIENASVGGEWRRTRDEAVRDLAAYLQEHS